MRRLALFIVVAIAACNPYDPDLPSAPFLCGPPEQEKRCPDGYTCTPQGSGAEVCVDASGVVPPDAGNTNCADDSPLEPNNTYMMAWQTPVDQTKNFPLAGLAICPTGDRDTYAVTLRVNLENLEMVVEYELDGAPLQGSILNAGGNSIASTSPVAGAGNRARAYAANLPPAVYYVQVYGPATGGLTTNNYKLDINVTGP